MAETLLFSFAELLIGKLASAAVQEASSALGVHRDLQQMKATMALIRGVLLDAEQKNPQSSALSEWLIQVKRVFSDAEDIVDDFECEALRKHVVNTYGGYSRKVRRFFSSSNPLVYRLRMAHQIQDINTRLAKLAADRNMFGLQIIDHDRRVVHVREMTYSHVNPSNVTGREHDKNEIVKVLVEDGDNHKSLSVIPIVGMGGLGKTTLAKLVFNDNSIKEFFPLKLWVCVSNDFQLKNVLVKILNSIPNSIRENFNNFDIEQLQIHLRNKVLSQKFLLVLDDVWNEDPTRWDELKEIIDVGIEGSKILVTTRSHAVAAMMHTKSSNSYLLECLSEEDSFSLFVKSAFKDEDEKRHPELLEIGKEIVEKCGGLPLAVRTLGSSLISRDKKEWESIRDNEIWNLKENEKGIMPALKLSYDQLPSYLKPCFASFSLFPEDIDMHNSYISTLWGALGFLPPPKENEPVIDVASQLLHELWSRSFLSDYFDLGGDCSFKLHDLVHDLAISIAKGEFERIDLRNPKMSENVQHLAFMENNLFSPALLPTGLRTVCFPKGVNDEALLNTLVSRCKYLRVLELSLSEYESLPSCIGKLKHLRHLNLEFSEKLERLPDSVCKLQNLQTLNLYGCIKLQKLPKGIRNLISLRDLNITTKQADFPGKEIATLTSLENLYFSHCNLESLFEGILLSTLKKLSLYDCGSLKPVSFDVIRTLNVLIISKCDKLELSMGLSSQIPGSRLKVLILEDLPQLITLPHWLKGSAKTLTSLSIDGCINLEELPEWLPTLISVKLFDISNCPNLLRLPDNMHHLTNLEDLEITGCPELCKRLKPEVGEDWHKISHIKEVYIDDSEEDEEEFSE